MAKVKRIVSTGFWDDTKVMDDFSPEDKYFMLYLLTNPHTTQLGIYELPISSASNETGYTKDVIRVLLDRFETKYELVKYSKDSGEVAIKNYLKHSIIKGGKPVMDCLLKEEKSIKDKSLLKYIYNNLSNIDIDNITVLDYIKHIKDIYINNNDNDNERIVDESSKTTKKKIIPLKNQIPPRLEDVADYCSQRNNNIDPQTFIDFYESKGWLIGKEKMKDWQASVRTWEKRHKPSDNSNKSSTLSETTQQQLVELEKRQKENTPTMSEAELEKFMKENGIV